MGKSKKSQVPDYIRKQRGDWGAISPVTKVIPNKKKNPKIKHKNKEFD
jgi:hypothetical protein